MIDFEALASERAAALSQPAEDWLETTRQAYFQTACSMMSDGEIMQLFAITDTPQALASLTEGLAEAAQAGETMPFDKWKNAFAANKLALNQGARLWAQAWPKRKKFSQCLAEVAVPTGLVKRKRD